MMRSATARPAALPWLDARAPVPMAGGPRLASGRRLGPWPRQCVPARARATARAAVTPGRVAVVTGAGSGIGLAVSLALVARGAHVVGVGRRREALERARELAGGPGQLDVVTADVASSGDREAVASHVRQLVSQGSTLEWLVHNAGVLGEVGPPSAVTEEGFRSTMAINVEGPLFLTQALSGELAAAPDGGRVLHVSSGAAYAPLDGWLSYCTSKAYVCIYIYMI